MIIHTYGHNDMYTYLLYHTHDKILLKMYSCFSSHTQQASIQTHLQADERAFSLNPSSFSLYRHNLSAKGFFFINQKQICATAVIPFALCLRACRVKSPICMHVLQEHIKGPYLNYSMICHVLNKNNRNMSTSGYYFITMLCITLHTTPHFYY